MDIITTAMSKTKPSQEVEFLIKNYIETVRWHIVGDEKIMKICNDIYSKHKKALDLIFEYKVSGFAGVQTVVKDVFKKYTENNSNLKIRKEDGNYIHFLTPMLVEKFPDYNEKISG